MNLKKCFYSLCITSIIITSILACSKNEDINSPAKSVKELKTQLQILNENKLTTTRIKINWRKLGNIIYADAAGAIMGSIGGGAGSIIGSAVCSLGAAKEMYYSVEFSDTTDINISKETGDIHGYIVNAIYNSDIKTTNIDTLLSMAIALASTVDVDCSNLNIKNIKDNYLLQQEMISQTSIEEYHQSLIKSNPNYTDELDIVYNYVETVAVLSDNEIKELDEEYKCIIQKADIPQKSKEVILDGESVATNSAIHWDISNANKDDLDRPIYAPIIESDK